MNPARWRLLSPLLDRALDMTDEERERWLASLRSESAEIAGDVQALLDERDLLDRERFLERADRPPPSGGSLAGQVIGAYTLVEPIGQGGMGSVWLARRSDGRFEGRVAVKLLRADLVGRAGEDRFRREGMILARLTHAHIAHLIDAGVSSFGQPYLVLEYVEGEPIDRYCDGAGFGVEARVRLFLGVLEAVGYAHANLVVHRDLKPTNVLVSAAGEVKLLDFGIAKLLEGESHGGEASALTREAGRALTPEYAAPEQVTGDPITTATDVYSLGALLYVLLAGRHPAGSSLRSPAALLRSIVDTDPQKLSDAVVDARTETAETPAETAARRATTPDRLRRLVHGDLETIVAKALKKRPEERYASIAELAADLQRYLDQQPISARPDTLVYRTAKFVRRHTRGVVAGGAMTLLLVGLVGFYTLRLAAERDRARLQADKAAKASELLTDLLTGADPYRTRDGREPTLRGLLDAGAERVLRELGGLPELQAEMLTVIGRVYRRLGVYDKAQPLLEAALASGRRVLGPEHEDVAQSLSDLGVLLAEKGDYAAAGPILEEALRVRRKLLGAEHPDVAVTLVELGRVYQDQGFNDRAEPLEREALAIRRKVLGEEHRETAVSLSGMASVLRLRGDLAGAEALLRRCLETNRKALGEDVHPNLSTPLNDLGLIAAARGDHRGAESLFRQALDMGRESLGEKHPIVTLEQNNLARALLEQARADEASGLLEEAVRNAAPVLGDDHPLVATYRTNLARAYLAAKQPGRAEPLLRRALETRRRGSGVVPMRRRTFPEDDWSAGATEVLLAAALGAAGS